MYDISQMIYRYVNKLNMLLDFVGSYFIDNYKYDYWHCPHPNSKRINEGDYIIDFRYKTNYSGPFDENGVPLLDLKSQHWAKNQAIVYSSVIVSQYALGFYSLYLENKNTEYLEIFVSMADSLISTSKKLIIKNANIRILYMDLGNGLTISGMAQGQAISVWCRAYNITKNYSYLSAALDAYNLFKFDVANGGVIDSSLGFPIIEEWVIDPYHILNGHLFAFAGIIDLMGVINDIQNITILEDIKTSYEYFKDASNKLIEMHDMGFWSRYSLKSGLIPNIASKFYHSLHINMLNGLHELTGSEEMDYYARKWNAQLNNTYYNIIAMALKLMDKAWDAVSTKRGYV